MVIVWRLRGNIIRTALCWVVWHNVHSKQHTHMSSFYRSSRLGLSHWDPYTMRRGGFLELYTVTWWSDSGRIHALSERLTGFLQCFDTVGLVIWPVKIVPEMTYNVSSGALSLYTAARDRPGKRQIWKKSRMCGHTFRVFLISFSFIFLYVRSVPYPALCIQGLFETASLIMSCFHQRLNGADTRKATWFWSFFGSLCGD